MCYRAIHSLADYLGIFVRNICESRYIKETLVTRISFAERHYAVLAQTCVAQQDCGHKSVVPLRLLE